MGEQDALPSTQDAFPITEPRVIITPQVTSGRAVDALMKFLPREVMVEVVDQERETWGRERVDFSEPPGVSLRVNESTGDAQVSAHVHVAAPTVSAIDELAQAVAAKAAMDWSIDQGNAADLARPIGASPSTPPVSKSRPARKRSRLALPEANVSEAAARESFKSDGAIAEQTLPAQPDVSPILELAQVVAAMVEATSTDSVISLAMVTPDALSDDADAGNPCDAATGGRDAVERISAMTSSPIGPSSQLSALDFSRLTAFADDPPSTSAHAPASVIVRSHRLSGLSRWLVPDFVGRAIQHPVLQILAGIGVSLLVFWWILGQ